MIDIMRLPKPLHFLLASILLAALWLGYWIGQISQSNSSSMPQVIQQEGAKYQVQSQLKASHHFNEVDNMHNRKSKTDKHAKEKFVKPVPSRQSTNFPHDNIAKPFRDIDSVVNRHHAAEVHDSPFKAPLQNYGGANGLKTPPKSGKQSVREGRLIETLKKASASSQNGPANFGKLRTGQNNAQNTRQRNQVQPEFKASREHYYLLHGDEGVRIHGRIHENIRTIPEYIPKNHYIFTSKKLPTKARLRPSIANGHIGTPIHGKSVFMNGLYCGGKTQSHRAEIPSTCSMNITEAEPPVNFTRLYSLNVGEGMYTELLQTPKYNVTHRIYAHRTLTRLMVVEVDLVRTDLTVPQKLKVTLNKWRLSPDLTFYKDKSNISEVSYKVGTTNAPERRGVDPPSKVHVLYDHIPDELEPPATAYRTKWVFLTAIASTEKEVFEAYRQGARLAKSNDQLYAMHVEAWAHVWGNGSINVVGNDKLARAVYGSLFYILSSLPLKEDKSNPFIGLSPSGLPFGAFTMDYQGHVFWDQETWMYPPILMLHPDLGRQILLTRNRTQGTAAENAKLHGFKGYQYPWESAYSGIEVSPDTVIGEKEIHITGDISFAIMQYLHATGDIKILDEGFLKILAEIANYWVSRLRYNATLEMFTILDVIPPDEYQHDGVNNSVFTNTIAYLALEAPMAAFRLRGKLTDHWRHFQNIYIPFNEKLQYHPEFDGYKRGTKVKQADAILLGYPLQSVITDEVRRNDLNEYGRVTDVGGPAMSWAMFAINYLKIGEVERARDFFDRNFLFIKNEFQVWHETAYGEGAANFITGMGGFLQMIIFGYAGLGLYEDALHIEPVLPPDSEQLQLMDFEYLGSSLNLFVERTSYKLVLVRQTESAPALKLVIPSQERQVDLEINQPVFISPSAPSSLQRTENRDSNNAR